MSNRQPGKSKVKQPMRPNIRITHALNGRVKDYAAEHGLSTSEAYERIIETGLETLEAESQEQRDAEPRVEEDSPDAQPAGDDLRERAEAALDELDVPGRDAATERKRRQAVMWAWDYLREHGDATSSEIANATFGYFWDTDLGYSLHSRYPGYGLWDGYLRDTLDELPGVEGPPPRGNEWEFVDEDE